MGNTITLILSALIGMFVGLTIASQIEETTKILILVLIAITLSLLTYSALKVYLLRHRRAIKEKGEMVEGAEVGFVVDTFHDLVTRLKEKERELARLKAQAEERAWRIEAYNENILQSIPSGVITVDREMQIKSVNSAAERILGIRAEEIIGRGFDDVFEEPLTSLIREGEGIKRFEFKYTTRDKRQIWLGITPSQLRNKDGEVIGMLFIFTDLTEIKILQDEMKLKERLSQLGEMSAGIAHELRNSMSVISGYAKLLTRGLDADHMAAAEAMSKEIKNMDIIISELLAFAKPAVLNLTCTDLNDLVEEAVSIVEGEAVVLSIDKGEGVLIDADRPLLKRAITDLLINAVESMPNGGRVDVVTRTEGESVVMKIKDTGKGIPDDIKDKIFLPFFTTKEKGIGLGLAIVQKIVISHNGHIEFESEAGKGSTFIITLPRHAGDK